MLDILTFLMYILTFLVKDENYKKQKKKLFKNVTLQEHQKQIKTKLFKFE